MHSETNLALSPEFDLRLWRIAPVTSQLSGWLRIPQTNMVAWGFLTQSVPRAEKRVDLQAKCQLLPDINYNYNVSTNIS
jgi:hypothetical protein